MEKFSQFIGSAYYFTTQVGELHKDVLKAFNASTTIDFTTEPLVAACGIDQWGSRGNFWVIVTQKRVCVRKGQMFHLVAFSDIAGLDRPNASNIALTSGALRFNLFQEMLTPHRDLADRMARLIHDNWEKSRQSPTKDTGALVDQLERLSKLREAGHLTAEEFDAQKATLLSTPTAPIAAAQLVSLATPAPKAASQYGCGSLLLACLGVVFLVSICSKGSGRSGADIEACRTRNLQVIRACTPKCSNHMAAEFDACVSACASARGQPIQDCR